MPTEQEVNDATARARAKLQAKADALGKAPLDAVGKAPAEWAWTPAVAFHPYAYGPGYTVLFADGSLRLCVDGKWGLIAASPFAPR